MSRPTISLEVARHVLWHFGDTNLGQEPGGHTTALIVAIMRADPANRERHAAGFPEYVAAVVAVKDEPWGLDWLRGLVKADLDHAERGLDFGAVLS